jgi:hypothetical protein
VAARRDVDRINPGKLHPAGRSCHGVPFSYRPVGAARQGQQKLVSGVHTAYRG